MRRHREAERERNKMQAVINVETRKCVANMCYMFENVIMKPSILYGKNVITITGINHRLLNRNKAS